MRRLFLAVLVGVGLAVPSVFAAERTGVQKALGGFRVNPNLLVGVASEEVLVAGSAQTITGASITCGGTACTSGIYNGDSITDGDATNANGVFEINAAANTTVFINFDPPIRTTGGILAVIDTNVLGFAVYAEQATP